MARLTTDRQLLIEARVANEQKSAAVAYALWFFLGLFSAHRFYLGRPGTAILQILSYFILVGFVWFIIDAFLIPSMVDQHRAKLRSDMMASALALPDD
ncbi:TM2 domain-containing protein [Mesorhizobium sp. CAU 1741]|uniref:TM2 domain-containing protein n=1 Tax=Mesorhizobium sp. CAU 1741 TaxID=3140366 RepID=UPI00325B70C3